MNAERDPAVRRPRLGFLGVGWIGLDRLTAVARSDLADIIAMVDPDPAMQEKVRAIAPAVSMDDDLDAMLARDLDGVVIATPSALHASQAIAALDRGAAVFCQKPLGRDFAEARRVVEAARRNDRLLGVDLSYRATEGMRKLRHLVRSGAIGHVFAAELAFHNAYGPDKAWFYDRSASGGGCLVDLGVHLADLLLWVLDWPDARVAAASCFRNGHPATAEEVEDYIDAHIEVGGGAAVARLACSWNLHAGEEAHIAVDFHGTNGGLAFRNVGGSFRDFRLDLRRGTSCETLRAPPDDWGGRAICEWADRLAQGGDAFDDRVARHLDAMALLDGIAASALPS